ncbi:MAG: LysM peptidoglycan-binding domain-containing M23 family metallopeptidase [Armatimonadota bacterium]|nr:LysM peptidoglycan-binding domain-containing M23 family metallopeptidase [Armatimonadota bacterium]MDR7403528.1 LysM peptidoglycan-binding domain-containing M23 family metallopeptidase [Armatimonadota bacterium]
MRSYRAGLAVAASALAALLAPAGLRAQPASPPAVYLITVVVRPGDTLWSIARRYGVTVEAIVRANGLSDPHRIYVGQRLAIPVPARLPPDRGTAPADFVWPLRGEVLSGFGARGGARHDGVDIAGEHGAPVVAARAGRVAHAGWYYAYGLTVIVDHGDGLQTLYGHLSSLLVRAGDAVRAGQPIARVGCTGRCSGSHLHFEIRVRGRAVDPSPYLAGRPPVPGPAVTSASSRSGPAGGRSEGPTTVESVVVEGDTVVRTVDTFRGGRLVARREEVVTAWGGLRRRVVREYRVEGGVPVLVSERVAVEEEQRD